MRATPIPNPDPTQAGNNGTMELWNYGANARDVTMKDSKINCLACVCFCMFPHSQQARQRTPCEHIQMMLSHCTLNHMPPSGGHTSLRPGVRKDPTSWLQAKKKTRSRLYVVGNRLSGTMPISTTKIVVFNWSGVLQVLQNPTHKTTWC